MHEVKLTDYEISILINSLEKEDEIFSNITEYETQLLLTTIEDIIKQCKDVKIMEL